MRAPDEQKVTRPAYETARFRVLGNEPTKSHQPSSAQGRISTAVVQAGEYMESDWDAESYQIFAEGAAPGACPECGRTGFYGPRFVEPNNKYRACRFCGFWQRTGGVSQRYLPTAHSCSQWPEVSKARYIWWVAPETDSYQCPFCHDTVAVAVSLVPVPAEDQDHPWWKVPQNRPQSFYHRLWKNWECSAGRTIL
jgi:hypothetical protein